MLATITVTSHLSLPNSKITHNTDTVVCVRVCCRHGAGQLKVMFIGGPNQRKDYHIEEGEEVKGTTALTSTVIYIIASE